MYNKSSDNGGRPHSPAMRGIVDSGADLLKTMYDVKIFFRSITYVFQRRGVVEGGTGAMNQTKEEKSSK